LRQRLTRRANQGHDGTIADIVSLRRKSAAGFLFGMIAQSSFNLSKLFGCILCSSVTARLVTARFDTSGKSLAK
jgi:hypothetical protein